MLYVSEEAPVSEKKDMGLQVMLVSVQEEGV